MKTTVAEATLAAMLPPLHQALDRFAERYPGDSPRRQPVHTVYGGAHLFRYDTAPRLGVLALRSLETYGPDFATFARAVGLPGAVGLPEHPAEIAALGQAIERDPEGLGRAWPAAWLAWVVHGRVLAKLDREPVEDFRIDFEDGYGSRPDDQEDATAVEAAQQLALGLSEGTLPPFIGIRIKPWSRELQRRSARTLDLFVTALVEATGGRLPENFVVTLPKVSTPEEVHALVEMFKALEAGLGLEDGALKMELMIETTQSLINAQGRLNLPLLIEAAQGRCLGAHFGTYDYTAGCDITAAHQHMAHPVCDLARGLMKVALAGTGIWLSDGATNVMPVALHREGPDGGPVTQHQMAQNRAAVHAAWALHHAHTRHSLVNGFYQGWDLHPAQLPTRYAAVFTFFLEGLEAATERLSNFLSKAAQATLVGDIFDDAATGQGLLNFFLRGINCGALTEGDALATGISLDELRGRSFARMLENRRLAAAAGSKAQGQP